MDKFIVKGPCKIKGEISISGSKNAALPILASTILFEKEVIIKNLPRVKDIDTMINLLKSLGSVIQFSKNKKNVKITKKKKQNYLATYSLVRTMRAGILVLGALVAKHQKSITSLPGGCLIGARPVNYHLNALKKLGMKYEIKKGLNNLKLEKLPEIICEPGRAIVAESGSTIVRVNLRKKQKLYINDGTYGTLFDAGVPNIVYPSKLITNGRIISKKLTSFDFYGPTCDSMDYMKGPFILPNNIKENDYIELGQLGAYGLTFRTNFNGFYSDEIYEVEDSPIMTMYDKEANKEFLVA